jgi:hypothetical protein
MRWLTESDVSSFLSNRDYDLRISGNARWIDQKCTADVVTVIADCILQYNSDKPDREFSTVDIWRDKFTVEYVEEIFKKPKADEKAARNEYDKFFGQPMKMLAYAGVLNEVKKGNRNYYTIAAHDILEYIALRDRNALAFIQLYIAKVLSDSSIKHLFDVFFDKQTKTSYDNLKTGFRNFLRTYTNIGSRGSDGKFECGRIFSKVVNPLAFDLNKRGTKRGHISKHKITYDMLMYNKNNFRDIYADKQKGMTRKEYAVLHPVKVNDAFYNYQSSKAKRLLRIFNAEHRGGVTEHRQEGQMDAQAIHCHHIFPKAGFPTICYFLENLIMITPTQHYNYAHNLGSTNEVNEQYQNLLLLSKTERIRENLSSTDLEQIYEFGKLLIVLNVGFDTDEVLEIADMDFDSVINAINVHYGNIVS